MNLPVGFLLQDRYRIEALLGRGGMGAVYRAIDTRLGHSVAIKQNLFEAGEGTAPASHPTRPEDTEARRDQFEREARLLASLKHAGLPKVTDYFFVAGEGQYLVMDFIEGQDFSAVVHQLGGLREDQAAGFMLEVAQVLEYLHSQTPPIIHRDIKPANIRVTPNGQVFLVDFGVAKVGTSEKTMFGAQAVTPGFSPLEQFGGDKPTDERADIYSLAATLYTLVFGAPPPTAIELLRGKPLFDPAGPAALMRPGLLEVIARGMALEPEDRYQSVAAFRDALHHVFPERNRQAQQRDTVQLVTQIYSHPGGAGSEMGVVGPTGRPGTGAPASGAPGTGAPGAGGVGTSRPGTGRPATGNHAPAPTMAPTVPMDPTRPPSAPTAGGVRTSDAFGMGVTGPAHAAPTAPPTAGGGSWAPGGQPPTGAPMTAAPAARGGGNPALKWVLIAVAAIVVLGGGGFLAVTMLGKGGAPAGTSVNVASNPGSGTTPPGSTPPPAGSGGTTAPGTGGATGTGATTPPGTGATPATGAATPVNPNELPEVIEARRQAAEAMKEVERQRKELEARSAGTSPGSVAPPPKPAATPGVGSAPPTPTSPPAGTVQPITPPATPPTPPPGARTLGDTLIVSASGGAPYRTLEEALQAHYDAAAGRSRKIFLRAGSYTLTPEVVLHTPIEIVGQGNVTIQGSGPGAAVRVRRPGIVLRNVTIRGAAKYAVLVVGDGEVRLDNCQLFSPGEATLALTESGSATLGSCTLTGGAFGILADRQSRVTLNNCTVREAGSGVQAREQARAVLTGGSVTRNRESGLLTVKGGTIETSGTSITDNGANGATAREGTIVLNGGRVSGNAGFGVMCAGPAGVVRRAGCDLSGNTMGEAQGCP